jgi:serine/threonine-protein kinase
VHCGSQPSQPTITEASETVTIGVPPAAQATMPAGGDAQFSPGDVIANRYHVVARIGQGGMGSVYKVFDREIDKVVALKTIRAQMASNPTALDMFKKELVLARQVTHRNICRLYDLGSDRGVFFLTMEFLQGQSLRMAIRAEQKATPEQAAEIMLQAAEGLEAAHEAGIVHRDLKPDNIMIQTDGKVLVMDFGIARPVKEMGTSFAGTPEYASPEQLLGRPQDRRSDLYSFGLIFYELLCGTPPGPKPTTMAEARERAAMTAPPLHQRDPHIPKELSDIVARCLAIRPEDRFASARDLAEAIENWLHPKPFYVKPVFTWSTAAGVALLAISAVMWINRKPPPAPPPVSLLVADFENKTHESVLSGTLEPALQVALEGASFVTTYDRGQAERLITQLRPSQPTLDMEGARLVAGREGIDAVVGGSIERQGDRYRLTLRTISPADGKELLKEQRETTARDQILGAVGRLAVPVRRGLGDKTPASEQIAAAETFTASSLEAANQYSAAQEFQYRGQREEAARAYAEAIRLDPAMGRAYAGLAVVNFNLNRPAEALKDYELALSHIGRMSEREKLRTRGGYFITANDPGKAAEEFTTLVQKYPADTGGHSNLALALLFLGQTARALEEGRRSLAVYPRNLQNRNNVALYALFAGDYQTAAQQATTVLKQNPKYRKAYIALALAALAQGHPREGQAFYQQLAAVDATSSSMGATGLADLAVMQGRLNDAVNTLRRGIAADEAAEESDAAARKLADLAQVYMKLGRKKDAQQAADRAIAGTVGVGALTEAAVAYADAGAYSKATAIAARFRDKVGAVNQATALLIDGYAQMAKAPVDSIATFRNAQKALDTWLGHVFLGQAYLAAKDPVAAQAEFETCLNRSGEALAAFVDDIPTARYLPPVWYYLAQSEEGLNANSAKESYRHFLAFHDARSQDPLAALARYKQ